MSTRITTRLSSYFLRQQRIATSLARPPDMKRKLDTFQEDRAISRPYSAAKSSRPMTTIELDEKEEQLRLLLLNVAKSIDESGNAPEPVVLRWAGGWVRDKLLGVGSHDIDVAINIMTGVEFAKHMCTYCDTSNAIQDHNIGPKDIGNLHNVARNPDKSKHLETAMVRMFGLDLDFVNLRKEMYTQDSRNPQIEFGTAKEDALRRDATINALFYNLKTKEVEDFTGGIPDMQKKLIRTPLEPLQTFTDDPLRVLRLIRFASRLSFSIDADTEKYMGDEQVLHSLRVKISRERVGIELEKMLKGNHPCQALRFIDRLKLYKAIFTDPAQENPELLLLPRWNIAYECLHELIQSSTPGSIANLLIPTEDASYVSWNLAALCPWMPVDTRPERQNKPKALPTVAIVAREGFKSPNKLTEVIAASHKHREEITKLKRDVNNGDPSTRERDRVGMAIRRWDSQGGSWKLQTVNAMLVEAMELLEQWVPTADHGETTSSTAAPGALEAQRRFIRGWQDFLDHLLEIDVFDAPSLKRLLDGKTLAAALGVKPGKWTGQALDICTEWQLRNPEKTDPVGAIEEVRARSHEIGLEIP